VVIPFLQALYRPDLPLPDEGDDYEHILQDIELFAIAPQVYHLLGVRGRRNEVPAYFLEQLKVGYTSALMHNLFMKYQEKSLHNAFEQRSIRAIPLKGIQFADRYFGHFGARATGDFDLYVPLEQLSEGIECVKSLGYTFEIVLDHHARLHRDGLCVELHWTLDKQYWSDLDPNPFWLASESFRDYTFIRQLSTPHTFYFICLHGARHQMDSLRYLMDVAQMLYACGDEIDFDTLFRQAEQDKTLRRIHTVLSIVYQQFPHLHEVKPLDIPYVNSGWNYTSIRNAKLGVKDFHYYRYKLHFKHLIFDTWKYALKSIKKSY